MGVFIAPNEFCPLAAGKGKFALPVDRAVDRPTVIFMTAEPPIDRKGSFALCQTANRKISLGLYIPHFLSCFKQVFREQFFPPL